MAFPVPVPVPPSEDENEALDAWIETVDPKTREVVGEGELMQARLHQLRYERKLIVSDLFKALGR